MTALLNNHIVRIVLVTAALLLIPLIAMQFNEQVNWTGEDFVVAGALLLTAGFALDMIIHKVRDKNRKIVALGVLAVIFLYVWAELAVGVFTNLGSSAVLLSRS